MEHKEQLEDLHKKSLEKLNEYLKSKNNLETAHQEKVNDAKEKWQRAWAELMGLVMYLENLEI